MQNGKTCNDDVNRCLSSNRARTNQNARIMSNLTQMASRGMKTYSELSRIELRNLQILKENDGKIKSVFVIRAA